MHRPVLPALCTFSRIVALAGTLVLASVAHAGLPLGGLAVAVTPAGDKLVAAGDTRTLLVLDPATLAVKDRIWTGAPMVDLAFDKSGKVLLTVDTDDAVSLYETGKWTKTASIPKRYRVSVSVPAGLFAASDQSSAPDAIIVHALATGKEVTRFKLGKKEALTVLGFDPTGSRLAALFGPLDSKEEQKLASNQIPKELRGMDRNEFQQKNDGKVSILRIYDVKTGALQSEQTLYYSITSSRPRLVFDGEDVIVNNYSNLGARISPKGEIALFQTLSGNYALGVSNDQSVMLTGGLRSFAITSMKSLQGVKGEIDRLPGWPEYFSGFAAPDGHKMYFGATSGYRIIKFGPDGKVIAAEPVR